MESSTQEFEGRPRFHTYESKYSRRANQSMKKDTDQYTTCIYEIKIHAPGEYQSRPDIGIVSDRAFPCPKVGDWPHHKHHKMMIIKDNKYLVTSGTYGISLFEIDDEPRGNSSAGDEKRSDMEIFHY